MEITLDRQVVKQRCEACGVDVTVVRGSVFDGGRPAGLYMIALHGHSPDKRLAHLAVALLGEDFGPPQAAAVDVIATPAQIGYAFVDWAESPWKGETYLGSMLDRSAVLGNPLKTTFLRAAGHIVRDVPEVEAYLV